MIIKETHAPKLLLLAGLYRFEPPSQRIARSNINIGYDPVHRHPLLSNFRGNELDFQMITPMPCVNLFF
jgi:hypothetical protein